jgi:DNA-binding NtrC family response regulator
MAESCRPTDEKGPGMNVLVYDSPVSIARLVRSLLRSQAHRVSISYEPMEAVERLSTSLFDALVIGPTGAPRDLADYLEEQYPSLPVVLAGVEVAVPAGGQVAAVIPAPLSARRFLAAFAKLDRQRREQIRSLPVQVATEGLSIGCRLTDLTVETMALSGESDEFQKYFDSSPRRVEAIVSGVLLGGEVVSIESDLPRHVRQVDVKLEGSRARELLASLLK